MPPPARAMYGEEHVPDRDECIVYELNYRLVSNKTTDKTPEARGLAFPAVSVSTEQLAEVFAQYVPVVHVPGADGSGAGSSEQQQHQQGMETEEQRCDNRAAVPASTSGAMGMLRAMSNVLKSRLGIVLPWADQLSCGRTSAAIAWSYGRQWLAAAHRWDAVLVYDLNSFPAAANGVTGQPPPVARPTRVLLHELQRRVACVAWRPMHSSMLAVGCEQGVCLWAIGRQPLGGSGFQRQGPAGQAWMSLLKFRANARVSTLAWSPDGRLLAGASCDSNRVMVWDAALGLGSALRLDVAPTGLLCWSPDGAHLFAAGLHGRFFLVETSHWTVRAWDTPGAVTSAQWSGDGKVLLMTLSDGAALVALHLVGSTALPSTAPAEQMLPVQLPGVTEHGRACSGSGRSCIADVAWDPSCRRLAVALQAPHPAAGCVALYSTSHEPVVVARLLGFARPWCEGHGQQEQQGQQGQEQEEGTPGGRSETVDPSSLRLAFARHFKKKGALLSVCSVGGDCIANIPLYF